MIAWLGFNSVVIVISFVCGELMAAWFGCLLVALLMYLGLLVVCGFAGRFIMRFPGGLLCLAGCDCLVYVFGWLVCTCVPCGLGWV